MATAKTKQIEKPTVMYYSDVKRKHTMGWYVAGGIWFPNEEEMHRDLADMCNLVQAPIGANPPVFKYKEEYDDF